MCGSPISLGAYVKSQYSPLILRMEKVGSLVLRPVLSATRRSAVIVNPRYWEIICHSATYRPGVAHWHSTQAPTHTYACACGHTSMNYFGRHRTNTGKCWFSQFTIIWSTRPFSFTAFTFSSWSTLHCFEFTECASFLLRLYTVDWIHYPRFITFTEAFERLSIE